MKDYIIRPTGKVEIEIEDVNGSKTTKKCNTVLPNAKKLISRCIAGLSNYRVDAIEIYKDGVLLISKEVQATFPSDSSVKFTAVFAGGEISGDLFNKAILKNTVNGEFSMIIQFEIPIKPTDKVAIGWEITIL